MTKKEKQLLEAFKARYSGEYAEREMILQRRIEKNHEKQLKVWREEANKANVKPW